MARLSRDKKRDQQRAAHPATPAPTPIDVHVPASGTGAGAAWVGDVRIVAAPGEEVQQAVLTHLHHIAFSTGHAVHATIHDESIGYVVPLQVDPDGASHFTADPVPMAPPVERGSSAGADSEQPGGPGVSGVPVPPGMPASSDGPPAAAEPQQPRRDLPTHLLRPVDEPVRDAVPTFRMRAVPEAEAEPADEAGRGLPPGAAAEPEPQGDAAPTFPPPTGESSSTGEPSPAGESPRAGEPPSTGYSPPTFPLHSLPDRPPGHAPGTVAPPTGVFGPPPVMDARPEPTESAPPAPPGHPAPREQATPPAQSFQPVQSTPPTHATPPAQATPPAPPTTPAAPTTPARPTRPASFLLPDLAPEPAPDPDPKPTPPRGFDAVAEAVLGDGPLTVAAGDGTAPPLLAEPLAHINEAVKAGRTDAAAELADRTLAQASGALGPEHPEVLHLRELAAYIAYLADDPVRSFQLSLDLAHARRHTRDAEAAYGNIQSAFTAWRAVRDPRLGLELGHALIGLWTELTAEDGPAADDIEQLDKARARMGRLTERAQSAR
ncbi:tetratricopeptide repeat protein [Streptomyces plumbiresistens]|uniref:Tetratricopeptide repeat protein n=1 Tax=Streptomyces plumbiresistens TaxID=511811 RepID=A0ABP7S6H2_9ACTN